MLQQLGRFAKSEVLNIVLVLLCCVFAAINIWLIHQNRLLQDEIDAAQTVTVGQPVQDITGIDFQDQPIRLSLAAHRATVLLVFSPTCEYCAKNWPNWNLLISGDNSGRTEIALVDITAKAKPTYANDHHAEGTVFVHQLDPKLVKSLHLRLTPETIVIGQDGKVEGVWTGVLSPGDMRAVERLL